VATFISPDGTKSDSFGFGQNGNNGGTTTTGGSLIWSDGGGSSSYGGTSVNTEIIIGVSDYTFKVTCWGLRPNTSHTPYLLTKEVGIDCAPIVSNGTTTATHAYGSPLITNQEGRLVFNYHFRPENSPYPTRYVQSINKTVAIIPVGQQLFKVSSADGTSGAQNYIESKPGVTS
jgi:hypothetical protein